MSWKYKFLSIKWKTWDFSFQENEKYIKENKFITTWTLPYHMDAKKKAKILRNNMTDSEKKIWKDYLQKIDININRQKPIDHFIADFYIPSCKLIIEIDGDIHNVIEQNNYDKRRDDILNIYWIMVARISNNDIKNNFNEVIYELGNILKHNKK